MTSFSRDQIETLLEGEPDTKLKKKILEFIEPDDAEKTLFIKEQQRVTDLLTEAFGKEKIVVDEDKTSFGRWMTGALFRYGKHSVSLDDHLDYQNKKISVYPKDFSRGGVEIEVDKQNPEKSVILAKIVADYLNKGSVPQEWTDITKKEES